MLPRSLMGRQCPDWNPAPRRCPVHKCLLGENQETGKGKGGREGRREEMEGAEEEERQEGEGRRRADRLC